MDHEVVVGLEVHCQLSTRSKIFSGAPTAYGAEPNTQASLIDLGFPGVLPVLNREAVRMAIKFALATDAGVARESVFARKNYFYPDLPKGYQISQYDRPLVTDGRLAIEPEDGERKMVGITRAHLEEDAGKSLHDAYPGQTGIDLNRAGTPLMEIVSEPDMRSAKEAVAYARKLHAIVRYLEICDGNMQEGSFRVDANVSVRPQGQTEFGTRTELKNLNSFRFLEKAINFEVDRQIDVLESGGEVIQETRLYDADKGETRSMRTKEEAHDYRYFPEPDLLPVVIEDALIESARADLPELPEAKRERFVAEYGLSTYDAGVLTATRELADYYEAVTAAVPEAPKLAANWVTVELAGALNKAGLEITESPLSSDALAGLLARIQDETISGRVAKDVFEAMWAGEGDADTVIDQRGLRQITDATEIERLVDQALADNPDQLEQYRAGKTKLFGFFVGQVMKASGGKANPQKVNEVLERKLDG